MKTRFIVLVLVATAVVGSSVAAATTGTHGKAAAAADGYVTYWDDVASRAYTAAALGPPEGHTIFAYLAIAEYDAAMAVEGGYEPFAVDIQAPQGASAQAAVAEAAYTILVHYLPEQKLAILDPAHEASLATISAGQPKTDGAETGAQVADLLIAQRADDGFRDPYTYTAPIPPAPGVWIPTSPPSVAPQGVYLGHMRPFALDSADQFRPSGPPPLSSKRWARDYNEVKELGSSASATRTPEQTLAARFWAEPPVQQAHAALRKFVLDHQLDLVDAARFMAMVSVTNADALIACFDAKYHYAFWRPITAVRAGDTDSNDATIGDPTWTPLIGTPNHPEYPSAHACITPAEGHVIARFLHTEQIDFTVPSLTGLGDRHFASVKDLEEEVANARIWGGIHYRSSVDDGASIATKTADLVLAHHFHRSIR